MFTIFHKHIIFNLIILWWAVRLDQRTAQTERPALEQFNSCIVQNGNSSLLETDKWRAGRGGQKSWQIHFSKMVYFIKLDFKLWNVHSTKPLKKRKKNLKYPDLWGYSLIVNSLFESRPKKHSNPSAYQMSKKIRKKVEISVGVAQSLRTLRLCKWIKMTSNQHIPW